MGRRSSSPKAFSRARRSSGRKLSRQTTSGSSISSKKVWVTGLRSLSASKVARTVALLPVDDPARDRYVIDLGTALTDSGDFERSDEVLLEVSRRAQAAGDERLNALALVQHWHNVQTYGGDIEQAREFPGGRAAAAARRDRPELVERGDRGA